MLTPVGPDIFRDACARFATSVSIATARDLAGNPHGLTISSFTPVSLTPPIVLICIDARCELLAHFRASGAFGVNVLSTSQQELSVAFAVKLDQRFYGAGWRPGVTGSPMMDGAVAVFDCRTTGIVDAGDHAVLFGEVVDTGIGPGEPLLYYERSYRTLAGP